MVKPKELIYLSNIQWKKALVRDISPTRHDLI